MRDFESRLVVLAETSSSVLVPVAHFRSILGEDDLEREVVSHPELLGEELLVLGSQLAEFTEDRHRLDVLAVDREGELVLIELKASETYRVTDLQALLCRRLCRRPNRTSRANAAPHHGADPGGGDLS